MNILSSVVGGIGLFLLGMTLMTDGLKAMAGESLKRWMSRLTGGTFSSIASGALITALVQSSSAATLMTIGFVSAGILSLTQAIGLIIGANIGSTSTGWMVSLLGLKINISILAMPMIGLGVFMKLFSGGRYTSQGLTVAGFGLIFVGIDLMQAGMKGLADAFDLIGLQGDALGIRILLVFIGIAMTVVMQSSSAAVAVTLTALYTQTIDLSQAAALVIGQNVGTTVTAALASLGAALTAKRAALAHILFNLVTGIVAFLLLPLFILSVRTMASAFGFSDEVSLAAFHTLFNLVGLIIFAPMLKGFARLIMRVMPDRGDNYLKDLDPTVAAVVPVALEAARRTVLQLTAETYRVIYTEIQTSSHRHGLKIRLEKVEEAIRKVRQFLATLQNDPKQQETYESHVAILQSLDHLSRLIRVTKEGFLLEGLTEKPKVACLVTSAHSALLEAEKELAFSRVGGHVGKLEQLSTSIAEVRRTQRREALKEMAQGREDVEEGLRYIDFLLWIDRLVFHAWRTLHHVSVGKEAPKSSHEDLRKR
ncbi:Na/Pi cotransporter family protein [Ammoniphilus sp. YIM 78166]|uniref:Na/Pi cotransporter family protein n=1 Tax=Ammoniphilus sp. YIM 78166 TaxID=1644106 RepID=UPI0010704050|nr:Na/Pi symporter [Ammoniphilus sp. YIM 78166]